MLDFEYSTGYWTICLFIKHFTKKESKDSLSPIFLVAIKNSFRFVQYPFFFAFFRSPHPFIHNVFRLTT